jgi:L-rhamnose mutarotase
MDRCLAALRVLPGRESELDRRLATPPADLAAGLAASGLSDVTIFRRGSDVWLDAHADPDRASAAASLSADPSFGAWLDRQRDVLAEVASADGLLAWYDEIFHTDAASLPGSWERGCFSLVIDTHRAGDYDDLHAHPWPEMIQAIHEAGYRDYSGFRRGAHVVYVGRYHPDMPTVLRRIAETEVAARWSRALDGVIVAITDTEGRHFTAQEVFHLD